MADSSTLEFLHNNAYERRWVVTITATNWTRQNYQTRKPNARQGQLINVPRWYSGQKLEEMENLRQQWNEACLQVGIPSLTLSTCARIMAILYHYGNNEAMVLNRHFTADCEYIQKRFHIQGSESPDFEFVEEFQKVEKQLRKLDTPPEWAKTLMKEMYNIDIY